MDHDTHQEILRLREKGMGKRAIARKLGRDVKAVRRVIKRHGDPAPREVAPPVPQEPPESKLAPYYDAIAEKAKQGLTGIRILREIKDMGYTGSRTILLDHLRAIRGSRKPAQRTFRRFETSPALEMQVDWSPYRVLIGGTMQVVHCFAMVLCYSRYFFLQFHRDERLPTLLAAHVDAFRFFNGVARTIYYDNMSTVTFGRRGREILWNPPFLDFARHYMYEPRLCRPGDPNRKGKVESIFKYAEEDFVRGRSFDSWEHLDRAAAAWLKQVANRRRHGTTRLVPEEAWLTERDFLTALPETPYPTYREEIRRVYDDGLIAVDGTRYSVPQYGVGKARIVTVRSHPRYIEILNREGCVIARHLKPDQPGGVILEDEHYGPHHRRAPREPGETDRRFLTHFPQREDFLRGLKRRMRSLAGVHLVQIFRVTQAYGEPAVAEALERAAGYGNYSAYAVHRILKERFPLVSLDLPPEPDTRDRCAQQEIEDVETGSFEDYDQYTAGAGKDVSDQDAAAGAEVQP
jgi:transposase